jgi:tol-pal system protein YbgF
MYIIRIKTLFITLVPFFITINLSYAQVVAGYNERIEQQELEIRRLTGEVETLKYKNQNLEVKLNGLRKEVELRFDDIENTQKKAIEALNTKSDDDANAPQNNSSDVKNNTENDTDEVSKILSPTHETSSGSATLLYDAAQSDLQRKNYESAAQNFERIIKEYPQHNLTPNAYYWLGETYYGRKQYDKAALTFLEGKRKFPNSSKAGHSLLKLGLSLHYLKQDTDACLTFDEVAKHYVPKDKSLLQTLDSSRKTVGCKH